MLSSLLLFIYKYPSTIQKPTTVFFQSERNRHARNTTDTKLSEALINWQIILVNQNKEEHD